MDKLEISQALRDAIHQNSKTFPRPKDGGMCIMTGKLSDVMLDEILDWMNAMGHYLATKRTHSITINTVLNSYYGVWPTEVDWEHRNAFFSYDHSVNHSKDSI